MAHFDLELLDSLVADGWLNSQRHPDADLRIFNYTPKTQYESNWTPETLACRGLILDADGTVVARPFPKFFNHGDPQIGEIPIEPFTVTEKIDGSLGIFYRIDDEPYIATRGSFTSEQAIEGTRMIREREIDELGGVTPLFEIVYPSNRIVVDYGDRRELVLLAAIDNATGLDAPLPAYDGPIVTNHGTVPVDLLAAREKPNSEGFVVSFESGLRVKVKFAEYVRLHKIVTGINARSIWESLKNGDDIASLLDGVPDEIHDWIMATSESLRAAYQVVETECAQVFFDRLRDADRKAIAGYFLASGANSAVLFRMLDGKPYDELIWKAIYPEPNRPESVPSLDAD
jgi:RNA ligase